jgi:CRP/FNR family transcriptional regulator
MKTVEPKTLSGVPLYRGLAEADLELLASVTRTTRYGRGEVIFREGDPSEMVHVVVEGRVKLVKSTSGGKEVILHMLGPGDPLGAVAVYDEMPYPASAVALEQVICLRTFRSDLFGLLERHPSLVRGLLKSLTRRLVELTVRLTELSGGHVEERLARLLVHMADDQGQRFDGGTLIPVPLSRQELADLTGTTIETCIRIMSRWSKSGLVDTRDDGFLLRDEAALRELGGE